MVDGLVSFILALIGLGFLVLIHEAGHYLMARRAGMRIEVFGIGFGRPIFSFMHKGVRINICWIPFGGYVKIAGMEAKKGEPQYQAPDGFFAKTPFARMKVALCGPLANILFALLAFSLIWVTGGREKSFSDVSGRVGWIDPTSELYAKGVRPGDVILSYNGKPVTSAKDHFYAAMTSGPQISVEVEKLSATKGESKRFTVEVRPYQHPLALEKGILTTGVSAPASFLVWNAPKGNSVQLASETQEKSGILPSDRLVWADGEFLFSQMQLSSLLNDGCLFITVLRDGKRLNLNVPRLPVGELKLSHELRGEISDWQYESKLQSIRTNQLWFLPYNLTSEGVVEGEISLLDNESKAKEGQRTLFNDKLLPHDQIVAVAGLSVSTAPEILKAFQEKHVLVIVDRAPTPKKPLSSYDADALFKAPYQSLQLSQLIQSIGSPEQMKQNGAFALLNPIAPKTRNELLEESGRKEEVAALKEEEEKFLQAIEDPQMRLQAQENLQSRGRQLFLGLSGVHDKVVLYNPSPLAICTSIWDEIYQTVVALFGGYLSPRWMSGPVGIVHVIQQQWSIGYKEALFWLGTISLNLAILNLLPLPVLDGGYVLLSVFEMITGVRFKVETIEKIVLPFAILLIILLVYLTYNDLVRLFGNVFAKLSIWSGG
jgi:regulator of sigma E protease